MARHHAASLRAILGALLLMVAAVSGCAAEPGAGMARLEVVGAAWAEGGPGRARVLGLVRLTSSEAGFGGWSGLWTDADGRGAAIGDEGAWMAFRLVRDANGRPVSIDGFRLGRLGGTGPDKSDSDAEELAPLPGGGWLVSFERRHRLWRYDGTLSAGLRDVPIPPEARALPRNEGLEALAVLASGDILMIAEAGEGDVHPAWIGGPERWRRLEYGRHGLFRPTGAAALPDGGALVVERRYTVAGGPAMRLVRLPPGQWGTGRLEGTEIFRLEPPAPVDNFEAVAVWRRADGRLIAELISDDNFSPWQSTLLLTLELPD